MSRGNRSKTRFFYIPCVYKLKITSLTAQRDTQSLVKILLKVPGLSPEQVSKGLRVPPFDVLSIESEDQAKKIKGMLEKLGAVCEIENLKQKNELEEIQRKKRELEKRAEEHTESIVIANNKFRAKWRFWIIVFAITAIMAFSSIYFSDGNKNRTMPKQTKPLIVQVPKASIPAKPSAPAQTPPPEAADSKHDLKKDLVKNPYNASAWKTLSEHLEKEGDTAAARAAKESYEKALKMQLLFASLAKTFGNNVRVEIAEDAVYYRTSKNLTDEEFYREAAKLKDSLSAKFPGRSLVIENYTNDPNNRVQSVRLGN